MTALIRLGSRGSPLALAQAEEVVARLRAAHPDLAAPDAIEIVVIKTTGDSILDRKLSEIGGKELFTKEIEEALLDGRIDCAQHSMKDMPTALPEGLTLGAILPREEPWDALFSPHGGRLADLPTGAKVGTSSLRRQALVQAFRSDLRVEALRGTVNTRMRRLRDGDFDATLLAVAGLKRLGQAEAITGILSADEMLPAVSQGAIGLEMRADDARMAGYLAPLICARSTAEVSAERAALAALDGSCHTPIAALARVDGGRLALDALVAKPDGSAVHRRQIDGPVSDPVALGAELGRTLRRLAGPDFLPHW